MRDTDCERCTAASDASSLSPNPIEIRLTALQETKTVTRPCREEALKNFAFVLGHLKQVWGAAHTWTVKDASTGQWKRVITVYDEQQQSESMSKLYSAVPVISLCTHYRTMSLLSHCAVTVHSIPHGALVISLCSHCALIMHCDLVVSLCSHYALAVSVCINVPVCLIALSFQVRGVYCVDDHIFPYPSIRHG